MLSFWCVELAFARIPGVLHTDVGYTGGKVASPTYRDVTTGRTGHAEAVRVGYDPARISFAQLLDVFFDCHDPSTLNRQGNDVGTQYRSAIFYATDEERQAAAAAMEAERKRTVGRALTCTSARWMWAHARVVHVLTCGEPACTRPSAPSLMPESEQPLLLRRVARWRRRLRRSTPSTRLRRTTVCAVAFTHSLPQLSVVDANLLTMRLRPTVGRAVPGQGRAERREGRHQPDSLLWVKTRRLGPGLAGAGVFAVHLAAGDCVHRQSTRQI